MIEDLDKYILIEELSRKRGGKIGRTALMKFMFFLQTIRNMPLGYRFTLYSYGPFDSDVLSDLGEAELLEYVESDIMEYPGGYGYEIRPTDPPSKSDILSQYDGDINWVIEEFGELNSAELELASTAVFADREEPSSSQSLEDLVNRVRQVKPHFTKETIRARVEDLLNKDLLSSIKG